MNANIRCLINACQRLNIPYKLLHPSHNLLMVNDTLIFTNWATPLVTHAMSRLLTDKDYCYSALKDTIAMPHSKSYLTPYVEQCFLEHLEFNSIQDIASDIEKEFCCPLIIKKNSGTHGLNVFKINEISEILPALENIFNEHDKNWDFVALAQDFIQPQTEYRLITLNGELELAYEKDISHACYVGNLSPLHWEGAKAVKVTDENMLQEFSSFIAPIFQKLPIKYCGIDIIKDTKGKFWLIEVNASPGFDYYTRDNGDEDIIELSIKMLKCQQASGSR